MIDKLNSVNAPVLVSACLTGLCTRYDAQTKQYPKLLEILGKAPYIPVCPEQLGGMPTPREAAAIVNGDGCKVLEGIARVITRSGVDVTPYFIRGAEQVLHIARLQHIKTAYLKARSPSCAVEGVTGVTAALLKKHNIETFQI